MSELLSQLKRSNFIISMTELNWVSESCKRISVKLVNTLFKSGYVQLEITEVLSSAAVPVLQEASIGDWGSLSNKSRI